jgi:hypothetical protein
LNPEKRHTHELQAGSIVFLVLALLLAVFSGDMLLVLAVGSAIAGLAVLTRQHGRAKVLRQAAVPQEWRGSSRTARAGGLAGQRMATRRHDAAILTTKRVAAERAATSYAHVPETASQVQVVQMLQQS